MPSQVAPQLLTVNEACARLRVGRTKLYDWIKAGEIKPTKKGRLTRISEREIERFIDRNTPKG